MKGLIPSRRVAFPTLIVAVALGIFCCRHTLLIAAGRWLNVGSPLVDRVDAVMVLGGDASTRPFVAAAIMRAGLASQVLIPKTPELDDAAGGSVPAHHEIILQVLLRSGVSRDAIQLLPSTVDSTEQEAQCLADYLAKHPEHRVAVITSDFHTRRTRLLFDRVCRKHAAAIRYIGAPTDSFDATNWWMFESGFVYYTNEYLKLAKSLSS